MNDNAYTSQFGPSTPGAINLISGQTNGLSQTLNLIPGTTGIQSGRCTPTANNNCTASAGTAVPDGNGGFTLVGDADPIGDVCSTGTVEVSMAGKNIGDLLNASHISWGWFEGGFNLGAIPNANGTYGCNRSTPGTQGNTSTDPDYIQHHQPFQYYATTANLHHLRPSSVSAIGNTYENDAETIDPANHQYDTSDFFAALQIQNIPAVSFLKAPGFEDGHPGYSDPLDEQRFIVQVLNALQASPLWSSTAVIITYDDSDGWYDHQMPPIVNPSSSALVDALSGAGSCTGVTAAASQQGIVTPATPLLGNDGNPAQGRCGYGTRWHEPVTERPELDSVEIWSFANTTRDIHPIHLHLVRFQVLDRRSFDADEYLLSGKLNYLGPAAIPPPGDGGWKDTVQTYPETVTRIIVRFEGYTGRYVWHCHLLEHAANEMMRPFEVVAKGMG